MNNGLKYPSFDVRLKKTKDKTFIFDIVRKKWLVMSPEEWVRQHVLHYLIHVLKISASKIAIEKELQLNDLKKRFDIVVYNNLLKPLLIVECKAPYIQLDMATIAQAKRYNLVLHAELLMITNGVSDLVLDKNNKEVLLEKYFSSNQ
ncbi:MAG: type I restriction enzyme HsdR N-terminal domain-containing protein [Bacteroidota bacterium]